MIPVYERGKTTPSRFVEAGRVAHATAPFDFDTWAYQTFGAYHKQSRHGEDDTILTKEDAILALAFIGSPHACRREE